MEPDEQEALSRRYAPEVVWMLPLKSGRTAVFNRAGDLCGYIEGWEVPGCWRPPAAPPLAHEPRRSSDILEDLGLL